MGSGLLWSKERNAQFFCCEAKKWIGNVQQSAQEWDHGEVRAYTDQHQAAHILRMTNNVFSGNGPAKRVCDEMDRLLDLQGLQDHFQIMDKTLHRVRESDRVIA